MNNIVIIGAIVVIVVLLIFIRLDRKRKRAMREWAETEKAESKRIEGEKE